MSEHKVIAVEHQSVEQYKVSSYVIGFALSLYFTLSAYLGVAHHLFSRSVMLIVLPALAFLQFLTQLIFFLHLGRETKPRWKLFVFLFMIVIVIILVAGSIWIMTNLNGHMQTPAEMNKYLQSQDGL